MALGNFSISEWPARRQLLVFAILILLLSYVFYSWYIGPEKQEIQVLSSRATVLRTQVQKAQLAQARLPQLRQAIRQQREHLTVLRSVLPEAKETADIILRVQQMAIKSHLKLLSFAPQKTTEHDFYEDWPILLAMEGSYNDLGTFFEKIGHFRRVINVDNISIRAVEKSTDQRTISATCTATTFVYQKPESS